jgi:hypothetical protein
MALFGLGGSSSKSSQSSRAQSTDYASSSGSSTQSIAFEELFSQLYGQSAGAAGKVAESIPGFQGQAASLFSGGMGFLDTLQEGGAGADYMRSRINGDSGVADQQVAALQADLGRLFNEELMPAITSGSVAGGTLGGGRQGVAQGLATEKIAQQFAQGSASIRATDQAARDAAATSLLGAETTGATAGLNALPNVLGLAESGLSADLLPMQFLAQVLGGPTTLTESLAESESFGQSTAVSKGKSKSGSFNFELLGA